MKPEKALEILKEQKLLSPLGQAIFVAIDALEKQMKNDEENAELKLELIATRSRLIDMEKALKLAGIRLSEEMGAHPKGGRTEFWKEHFIQEARGGNETSDIQNRR